MASLQLAAADIATMKLKHSREASGRFAEAVATLKSLHREDLERVSAAITQRINSSVSMIPELGGHLLTAGGKRLRPLLTLSAARALGYDGDAHIKLAAAVELIHGATLLHDDVVDDSDLRRGLKTANIIWGNKESVLVGDFIFSRAFELMVAAENLRVLQILSHASGVIAEGEVLQLSTQKNTDVDFDTYLAVIDAKTAALFAAAARAGAVIAGADERTENALCDYGRYLGVAFQLIDDALDYAGDGDALGKNVGDDFREGKMTAPIVFALARATPADRSFWRRAIAEGDQREDDLRRAVEIMTGNGALEETFACARRYVSKALDALSAAPSNVYSDALAELARQSLNRIH